MKEHRHLSWDNFVSSVLVKGQQRVHRISNSPVIEVFGDGINDRVGIWIESPAEVNIPQEARRLAFVSVQTMKRKEISFLEIATISPLINRQFYLFVMAVADRVLEFHQSAIEALILELQSFAALLEEKSLLTIERQLGLIGELIILERMISGHGSAAIAAWIGPRGEPHDFRIGNREFEVKTTAGTRRIHTIHNISQLTVSPGCSLFIISILLGPTAKEGGFSLAQKIESIQSSLKGLPSDEKQFLTALESSGYSTVDHSQYNRLFALRRPVAVVPIDSQFPTITSSTLQALLGQEAHRIDRFVYDVNVEGLESEEGTEVYKTAFPWPAGG
jgi:hypothetical protein